MDEKVLKQLANGLKNKNPEAIKAYKNLQKIAQGQGEEAEKAKGILNKIQNYLTQKAAHGAKLNYFRSLKNQCPEGEELYYYKKGGKAGCGCRKKEDGGEIKKAQKGSAIDNFKNRKKEIKQEPPKQDQAARDSIRINSVKGDDELEAVRPGSYKPNPKHNPKDPNSKTHIWVPDRTKAPYNKTPKKACGSKIKKHQEGSVITQFKMHRQGGSLNGIPFIRKVQ